MLSLKQREFENKIEGFYFIIYQTGLDFGTPRDSKLRFLRQGEISPKITRHFITKIEQPFGTKFLKKRPTFCPKDRTILWTEVTQKSPDILPKKACNSLLLNLP